MVDRVFQGGASNDANSWLPVGVPGDGDRVDQNGFPLTWLVSATMGVDDGTPAISNPSQFPASIEAAPMDLLSGVELTLRGTIANSNGDLMLGDGAKIFYTNSDAQTQDHGNFDNATTAPTLMLGNGSVLDYIGVGGSMIITINGGGAVISDGGMIVGFGNGTDIMTVNLGSDPAQCFCARPLYFVRCKGSPYVQAWGDGSMGDIEVTGLYNIDPVSGGGIRFDGNDDAVFHASTNIRIAQNIRCEGDPQIRYMQGYTSGKGFRCTGSPLTVDGSGDWEDLTNWLIGNHGGSFMRALGQLKDGWFIDLTDNPHSISLARVRAVNAMFSGNVFDLRGLQGSSDTGDCFATDASNAATDFTVAGQEITLEDNLVLPNKFTGANDGPIFLTLNGHLTLQVAHPPKFRILNNTGAFSNGGHVVNVDEFATVGATPPDTIIEHKRNIWTNVDSQPPLSVAVPLRGVPGSSVDVFTLGQSDENVYHNLADGLGVLESAAGVNDLATVDSPPIFAEPTRNLEEWARQCHDITEDQAIINLVRAGFPGYGSTPAVDAATFDVERLRQWVRAGFANAEPTHAGRGITTVVPNKMETVTTPLIDTEPAEADFLSDLVGTEFYAYNPKTGLRTTFVLQAKPSTDKEAATAVQGDHPNGVDLTIGVKLP